MRLPWIQVDADGFTRGEMLGRLLGVGELTGIALAMRMWRWALEVAEDGDFSGNVADAKTLAAGIGWAPEDAERLVTEAQRAGLVEMPVTGTFVRIRGLERYRRAFEKNSRRKPAPKAPVTGATHAGLAPEPARKTETEKEEDMSGELLPDLRLVEPQPVAKKPRTLSRQESWWQGAQAHTLERNPALVPEKHAPKVLNELLKGPLDEVGVHGLAAAWQRYLGDGHWRAKGWPLRGFVAQWRQFHNATGSAPPQPPSLKVFR